MAAIPLNAHRGGSSRGSSRGGSVRFLYLTRGNDLLTPQRLLNRKKSPLLVMFQQDGKDSPTSPIRSLKNLCVS